MQTAEKKKAPVPIRVTHKKTLQTKDRDTIAKLQEEFRQKHCLRLRNFFHPSVLREIQGKLSALKHYNKRHKGLASELCMNNNALSAQIQFFLNDQKIFKFVEQITGCEAIGCFHGRVYHMVPGQGHYHKWHTDWNDSRILGLSINLSREVYSGGALQLRHQITKELYGDIRNTGFGDALLFRLSDYLEHRVTDVTGTAIKTAFAGWFSLRPKYLDQLKSSLKSSKKNK